MRRRWLAGIFAVSLVWAILVAIITTDHVHELWGEIAAVGYGLALLTVLTVRYTRMVDLALGFALLGGLVVPLAWLAGKGLMQPEVSVVAHSGMSLIHTGTPYSPATVAGDLQQNDYNPYLPVMALFGLPRALFNLGLLTDPRLCFGAVFMLVFWLALRRGGARDPWRWAALVAGSPVIAFELAVGGTDVPMVAFLCLGFAFLWERKPVLAGLALGIGSAMKATAWPALLVVAVLLWVTEGRRAVRNFALTALGVLVACVGPFVFHHPRALVVNTIKFPLGLAGITSAARSPLPGYVIAHAWPHTGHPIVVALLALAGLAVAVSLVVRPPRTVPRAVVLLAGAMTLMFVLAPSTRFGYFIYPAALAIWLWAAWAGRQAEEDELLGEISVGFLPACVPERPPSAP
ncbi:MAG TPA: glycosyltransferase 87 family protein [Trebonia sp.]|nr:glycosyltransferase 87 family protein [Trebonia sp.]